MTDRQFDSYTSTQVKLINEILNNSKDYEELKRKMEEFVTSLEADLKRP
ncbi:MAG: hypothetical protein LBC82_05525 [Oscillospiraceae bacterium]|nr:hypothetical protein [Oscillospiraceae bacterium]